MHKHARILYTALALTMLGTVASAQNIRLNAFSGYTYQDKFPISASYNGFSYSEGRISDGQHYGGSIEIEVRRNKSLELLYQQQNTDGYIGSGFSEFGPYEVKLHYAMIGGLSTIPFSPAVGGYGGFNIGCGWMTGENSATKFAWGGKLGLQINLSETVGIRAGAQLLSPVQSVGGGFYFGTGGAGAGVSTYSSVYQFAWTGGLSLTLPRAGASAPPHGQRSGSMPPPPPPPPSSR